MVPRDIFPKLKSNIKLSSRQDGDGNEVEVEVRENEEQLVKFQEIVDLLVAAGYFRARIKGLSSFDKVVGGMTWCIENCNVDVDVDFLFQENATIGQKIALTEKIVVVLPKMKCPYGIEPHQIQGLDFIHIFPVIQWLVKTSMKFRQETFHFVRKNAVNQFNKIFNLTEEINEDIECNNICNNIKTVRESYRPKRQYRLKHAPPKDEFNRVQVTLLEYGCKGPSIKLSISDDQQKTASNHSSLEAHSEQSVDVLAKAMTLMNEEEYSSSLTPEEKLELQKHYITLQAELQDGGVRSREEQQLTKSELKKQIFGSRLEKLQIQKEEKEKILAENLQSLQETKDIIKEAVSKLNQIAECSKDNQSDISQLEKMIIINENLREQEIQFKEQCRNELEILTKKIEESKSNIENRSMPKELEKRLEIVKEKVHSLRLNLAKQNRIIAVYQRKLDDIPTRAELAQYQRRFLELYNQVAAKHKETKQYFTLYNTLNDTKMYISKELSLLNSIFDNYPDAMGSNSSKEDFLNELHRIVDSVKQNKMKVEARYLDEQKRRDNLNLQLQTLIVQHRKYVALVRQLSLECKRNEALSAELKHS